jgi:hypothetical protein
VFGLLCFVFKKGLVVLFRCLYCERLFLTANPLAHCGVCGFWDVRVVADVSTIRKFY